MRGIKGKINYVKEFYNSCKIVSSAKCSGGNYKDNNYQC